MMKESSMIGIAVTAAAGMAVGAAAVYVATQDHRTVRKTIRKLSRGAENALVDMDRALEHYFH